MIAMPLIAVTAFACFVCASFAASPDRIRERKAMRNLPARNACHASGFRTNLRSTAVLAFRGYGMQVGR
jgi:hypothetical protein